MSRSVQKRAWLESDRKLRAAWEGAVFAGKPDSLWQAVCKKVSGGWEFSAPEPVVAEKPKRVRKKKEAA